MSTSQEFAKNFNGQPVPEALAKLLAFQEQTGFEYYSEGFGLHYDDKSGLQHGWSPDPAFLDKLMPFAQANGSGSFYALWQYNDTTALDQLPVVLFGDEGGEFIVAENILGLLQLLTIDAEPMTYQSASFYKDEEAEPSDYADDYRNWLQKHFNLAPITDGEEVISPAQEKYKAAFDAWKEPFFG